MDIPRFRGAAPAFKFMVVLYKRPDISREHFRGHFQRVHGPLAEKLPGLKGYVQNFPADDPLRKAPTWDAIVELYWENKEAMEAAWASAEGRAATDDLAERADLERTMWSVVDEPRIVG